MKVSALIANGQIDDLSAIEPLLKSYARIVAVDGGLRYCKQLGILPALIVGDFDSAPKELLNDYAEVQKIVLQPEKDETDLEVAIEYEMAEGAEQITLFGAWGGRIDHSLTNALMLTRYPEKIRMETENEILFAIEKTASIPCRVGQTISLLPINGPVKGITTCGLKWELNKGTLDHRFIGISNICLAKEIKIAVHEGILLCSLIK